MAFRIKQIWSTLWYNGIPHQLNISCLDPLVFLLPNTFGLLGFQIVRFWTYLMKVIPETPRVHSIWNIRFYSEKQLHLYCTKQVYAGIELTDRCGDLFYWKTKIKLPYTMATTEKFYTRYVCWSHTMVTTENFYTRYVCGSYTMVTTENFYTRYVCWSYTIVTTENFYTRYVCWSYMMVTTENFYTRYVCWSYTMVTSENFYTRYVCWSYTMVTTENFYTRYV